MKRLLPLLLASLPLLGEEPLCEPPPYPVGVSGLYVDVRDASFRESDLAHQHLHYVQSNAALAYTHACNPYWGLIFGAGYVGTEVAWRENPFFSEDHFSYVDLNFGAYTLAMPSWSWSVTGSMFIDTAVLDLRDYALYQGVLYGKYDLLPCITLDVGFILEVGLNRGKMWPLFGIEYDPNERFSLNLVYPLDVSIEYDLCSYLELAGSLRFLRDRHRVLESEALPMGIYEYRTTGAEFDVIFTPNVHISVTGFVGSTFPGALKITDRNNHDAMHFKFKHSLYSGMSAVVVF